MVGIAASRLAERHWRPDVLLSIEGDTARGSARSIPGFDLIAALDACSRHLTRHGGHRAAAGLELPTDSIDAFRRDFLEHAAEAIGPEQLVQTESVDALVGVGRDGIGMDLAEQLERLGPFGRAIPTRSWSSPPPGCARSGRSGRRGSTRASSSRAARARRPVWRSG